MARTDKIYNRLVETVLTTGVRRESRAGRTISCFGASICLPIHTEFPLLTTRKIFFNGVFGELAAFITGSTMLNTFKEFGCNYWDMNAAAWERNKDVPQSQQVVGHIYGYQWRNWAGHYDQLYRLVEGINLDPYGRRHLLTTWDPADLKNMCLPPCHLLAQFYVHDGALSCLVFMRSVDLALGLPSDMILYATLQALVAKQCGLSLGTLQFSFGDTHIYEGHIELLKTQLARGTTAQGALLELHPITTLFTFKPEHAMVINYDPQPAIKYPFNV